MVINFNEGSRAPQITITGITSTINLSTASAEEIIVAAENMEKMMFQIDYSGLTYTELYRTGEYEIDFAVIEYGGSLGKNYGQRDIRLKATIDPSTGEVTVQRFSSVGWAPNIIYAINDMDSTQLLILRERILKDSYMRQNTSAFIVRWSYNQQEYVWTGNFNQYPMSNACLEGYSLGLDFSGTTPKVILKTDTIIIALDGTISHSNTNTFELTATPISNS